MLMTYSVLKSMKTTSNQPLAHCWKTIAHWHSSTSSKVLNSHKAMDAYRGTKLEANATLLEMESTKSDVNEMAT